LLRVPFDPGAASCARGKAAASRRTPRSRLRRDKKTAQPEGRATGRPESRTGRPEAAGACASVAHRIANHTAKE